MSSLQVSDIPGYSRLFCPYVDSIDYANTQKVFAERWLGLGAYVKEFEQQCASFLGVSGECAVAVNSGTAALNLAVRSLNLPKGSLIAVSALTFASSATCILNNGYTPFFLDSCFEECGFDLGNLSILTKNNIKALILVHFGGNISHLPAVSSFCRDNNITLIEDCAHTFASQIQGRKAGTWGDYGCYSFEEKKVMTTGDGGLLVCSERYYAERARRMRWVGIDKDTWARASDKTTVKAHWFYEISELGDKWNMNNFSAVLGISQLTKIAEINRHRIHAIQCYIDALDSDNLRTAFTYKLDYTSSYWLFAIRCKERDLLMDHLSRAGIATGLHYMPLHLQPLFRSCPRSPSMDNSEAIYNEIMTLPLHGYLAESDIGYICDNINGFYS